jgi:hypothetical protein
MNYLWMTTAIKKKQLKSTEYYYLFLYFITSLKLFAHIHYNLYFFKFFIKFKHVTKNNYFFEPLNFFDNKLINPFKEFAIHPKLNCREFYSLPHQKIVPITISRPIFSGKIFKLFTLFNYSIVDIQFPCYYKYKLFYIQNFKNELVIIDAKKIFHRWQDSLELLHNVFFYNFHSIVFSSPIFKNETLALNWYDNNFDILLWKYYFPFFIFKLQKYNAKSGFFFEKLASLGISFYLVVDCFYQYKNLFYLKKKNYYTVGLVSINVDPWLVTYPIIGFFENSILQFFFFKLLIVMRRQALLLKFINYKFLWVQYQTIRIKLN